MEDFKFVYFIIFLSLVQGCPNNGWYKFGSKCFFAKHTIGSPQQNMEFCASLNATLASIHSVDENNYLKSILTYNKYYWLGMEQLAFGVGAFVWKDGSEFNYSNWNNNKIDHLSSACFAGMIYDGKWYGSPCWNRPMNMLCQINLNHTSPVEISAQSHIRGIRRIIAQQNQNTIAINEVKYIVGEGISKTVQNITDQFMHELSLSTHSIDARIAWVNMTLRKELIQVMSQILELNVTLQAKHEEKETLTTEAQMPDRNAEMQYEEKCVDHSGPLYCLFSILLLSVILVSSGLGFVYLKLRKLSLHYRLRMECCTEKGKSRESHHYDTILLN